MAARKSQVVSAPERSMAVGAARAASRSMPNPWSVWQMAWHRGHAWGATSGTVSASTSSSPPWAPPACASETSESCDAADITDDAVLTADPGGENHARVVVLPDGVAAKDKATAAGERNAGEGNTGGGGAAECWDEVLVSRWYTWLAAVTKDKCTAEPARAWTCFGLPARPTTESGCGTKDTTETDDDDGDARAVGLRVRARGLRALALGLEALAVGDGTRGTGE